jgi:hypothetical protein
MELAGGISAWLGQWSKRDSDGFCHEISTKTGIQGFSAEAAEDSLKQQSGKPLFFQR